MINLFRGCLLSLCMLCFSAQALPLLQVDVAGILLAAKGVNVGGTLYDVEFVDGKCAEVFSGCDVAAIDFPFSSRTEAETAGNALLSQVFRDTQVGKFDTHPELTWGCAAADIGHCAILTPVGLLGSTDVDMVSTVNHDAPLLDELFSVNVYLEFLNTSFDGATVWARWSPSSQTVPEPSTIWSLCIGLAIVVATRRRLTL